MATTVISLYTKLRGIIGDIDSTNYRYTDAQLRDTYIPLGIDYLSEDHYQQYAVSGSGDAATIAPDPSSNRDNYDDRFLITLASAIVILQSEIARSANTGVIVSNAAGRTDLSRVATSLSDYLDRLESQFSYHKSRRAKGMIEQELAEGDSAQELRSGTDKSTLYYEGLPVVEFEVTT